MLQLDQFMFSCKNSFLPPKAINFTLTIQEIPRHAVHRIVEKNTRKFSPFFQGPKFFNLLGNEVIISQSLFSFNKILKIKVARYSFLEWIPPTFEGKLRRHKQRFGKIDTTVVLDKDENLLWSGLQWHRSCHSNEMTALPISLAAVFLGTGNCSSKIVYWSFFLQ